MAVYYLGNPIEKRKRMMSQKDAVYLDNDEVLASYGKGNKYYFLTGKVPFSDFTVWEYLSLSKSLELRRPLKMEEARELLLRTGFSIPLSKKLSRLDPIELRAVKLCTALRPCTNTVQINFDGILYSRRNNKRMQKLIYALDAYNVIVSVSDTRFVPKDGGVEWFFGLVKENCKVKIIKKGKKAIRLY